MKRIFTIREIILVFLLSFVISIPIIYPILHVGYYPTHDGEWAVVRAVEMFRELRDLQIPPRYSTTLNFEYGYPLFNFVYPAPYYLATILHLLNLGFIDSIKTIFALSVPFSFFFMYLASKSIWKNVYSGILSGILYLYLPYRIVDLYVRGSIGESVSFALFPLVIFFGVQILNNPKNIKYVGLLAFSWGFLIGTHNIMAVYMLIIFFFFLASLYKNKSALIKNIIGLILGFGLLLFFWGPAIVEKGNILLSRVPIADRSLYFVSPSSLIIPSWGYGAPTDINPFTYNLGIAQIMSILIAIVLITMKWKKYAREKTIVFLAILYLVFLLMMFPLTGFIWNFPLLREINYPWTLLLPLGFLASLLAGIIGSLKQRNIIVILLASVSIISIASNLHPSQYISRNDEYYMTNEATTTSSNELMPLWVKNQPSARPQRVIADNNLDVENVIRKSNRVEFTLNSISPSQIKVNTIYYPGWVAVINGKNEKIRYDNDQGLMTVNVQGMKSNVKLLFKETPLRIATDIVSVISLLIIIGILVLPKEFIYKYGSKKENK